MDVMAMQWRDTHRNSRISAVLWNDDDIGYVVVCPLHTNTCFILALSIGLDWMSSSGGFKPAWSGMSMVNHHLVLRCRFAKERSTLDIMGGRCVEWNVTVPNAQASGPFVRRQIGNCAMPCNLESSPTLRHWAPARLFSSEFKGYTWRASLRLVRSH
jgi:hypothetical protein